MFKQVDLFVWIKWFLSQTTLMYFYSDNYNSSVNNKIHAASEKQPFNISVHQY